MRCGLRLSRWIRRRPMSRGCGCGRWRCLPTRWCDIFMRGAKAVRPRRCEVEVVARRVRGPRYEVDNGDAQRDGLGFAGGIEFGGVRCVDWALGAAGPV